LQHIGDSGEKTLSDFSSGESGDSASTEKKPGRNLKKKSTPASTAPGVGGKNGELGAVASIKTLYEGHDSRDGIYNWVDYPPKQLSKSAAKAQDRVAIKVFKVKDLDKPVILGRWCLRYHMIEIQNPLLVAALAEVLKPHDVHLDTCENATFQYPFSELYFGYDDIVAKHRSLDDTDAAHPLRPFLLLLIRLVDDIFADTRARVKALGADGLISFKLAWTLFPKNAAVISWGDNCELLLKVTGTSYTCTLGKNALVIRGKVLRFDGRGFLWEDYSTVIGSFSGNRPVTELPAYPLELHEAAGEVRARLTARGRKVLDHQGLTYVNYTGVAIHDEGKGGSSRHNVDGRVLVDVVGYNKHHLAQRPRQGSGPQSKKRQLVVGDNDDDKSDNTGAATGANVSAAAVTRRLSPAAQARNKEAMLARDAEEPLLMFMLPLIEGYALKNKLWVSFYVEDIAPMVWNDAAYDHLVYNEQQKDLVMSFVESHCGNSSGGRRMQPKAAIDDVIAGKGECCGRWPVFGDRFGLGSFSFG
jgi:hypothetical protein